MVFGPNASTYTRDQVISLCENNFAFDPRGRGGRLASCILIRTGSACRGGRHADRQSDAESLIGPNTDTRRTSPIDALSGLTCKHRACSCWMSVLWHHRSDLDEDRLSSTRMSCHTHWHAAKRLCGIPRNDVTAQTYLGGSVESDTVHLVQHLRYAPNACWVLNGTLSLQETTSTSGKVTTRSPTACCQLPVAGAPGAARHARLVSPAPGCLPRPSATGLTPWTSMAAKWITWAEVRAT